MNVLTKDIKLQHIVFKSDKMHILTNKEEYVFDLNRVSKKLLNASDIERMLYKISPSGYGIHWPLIDEDLSFSALLSNL
jgi:hypothetical protein